MRRPTSTVPFFFFNDTATTEIYTLSLHDALPISSAKLGSPDRSVRSTRVLTKKPTISSVARSEEHTSELQSRQYLVCRLLLEKKKKDLTNNRDTDVAGPDIVAAPHMRAPIAEWLT